MRIDHHNSEQIEKVRSNLLTFRIECYFFLTIDNGCKKSLDMLEQELARDVHEGMLR